MENNQYSTEMYHAAIKILENRAEQLGEDELEHHGILGMKWGVRRYQNEDGSLTPEGRKRYYSENGQLNEHGMKAFYDKDGSLTKQGRQYINKAAGENSKWSNIVSQLTIDDAYFNKHPEIKALVDRHRELRENDPDAMMKDMKNEDKVRKAFYDEFRNPNASYNAPDKWNDPVVQKYADEKLGGYRPIDEVVDFAMSRHWDGEWMEYSHRDLPKY